eukprot:2138570-Rhodomonas_salina.1
MSLGAGVVPETWRKGRKGGGRCCRTVLASCRGPGSIVEYVSTGQCIEGDGRRGRGGRGERGESVRQGLVCPSF